MKMIKTTLFMAMCSVSQDEFVLGAHEKSPSLIMCVSWKCARACSMAMHYANKRTTVKKLCFTNK